MTSTDICNMALSMIGQGRIHDLDEESEQARQCKVYYDHIRKTLLSNFTWGFAHRFKRLVKVEGTFPQMGVCLCLSGKLSGGAYGV